MGLAAGLTEELVDQAAIFALVNAARDIVPVEASTCLLISTDVWDATAHRRASHSKAVCGSVDDHLRGRQVMWTRY